MAELKTLSVMTNGIRMRVLEGGTGPLVILCHGFPELGYSWRHQLHALAEAGYRAVAPDQRGYGGTDHPDAPETYTICHLAGDIVGLVHALGEEKAAIIGHDWGSAVAWSCALLRPDIFRAVSLLSVPYLADFWSGPPPTAAMREMLASGHMFYQLYFQETGRAEVELGRDVRDSLVRMFNGASGGISPEQQWRFVFSPSENLLDTIPRPAALPSWLSDEDLAKFAEAFEETGFVGGLNWYRNMDRDRELLAFLAHAKVEQPSMFVAGSEDAVVAMYRAAFDKLEQTMPGLRMKELVPGAGHWIQQERPTEVNRLLIRFLAENWPVARGSAVRSS
jgi:pimeloyl-ACP methyl ester carboxylesterase